MVSQAFTRQTSGPGRFASARLLSGAARLACLGLAAAVIPAPLAAQQAATAAPTVPDQANLARLVWSTITAVDHASRTGNYSVLKALGSPAFRAGNSEAILASAFSGLRGGVSLVETLSVEPVYEFPPRIENGLLRVRGAFRMRPQAVQFDLLYQWSGGWMIEGVAVRTVPFSSLAAPAAR